MDWRLIRVYTEAYTLYSQPLARLIYERKAWYLDLTLSHDCELPCTERVNRSERRLGCGHVDSDGPGPMNRVSLGAGNDCGHDDSTVNIVVVIIIIFLKLGRSSRGGRQKLILEIITLMVNHPSGSHQQSSRAAG